jgi:hypothetical protein
MHSRGSHTQKASFLQQLPTLPQAFFAIASPLVLWPAEKAYGTSIISNINVD